MITLDALCRELGCTTWDVEQHGLPGASRLDPYAILITGRTAEDVRRSVAADPNLSLVACPSPRGRHAR